MRAGRLRHRLAVQALAETRDADGGISTGWATSTTVWGSIEPLSGREFFEADASGSDVTHKIRVRQPLAATRKHRILFKSRTFAIESVLNVNERDREIVIMAKEDV